jgi:hypothetical protein
LRKATPQKKTLKRSKKSPSVLPPDCLCVEHRTVRWHTGLSGAHTPDYPVHQGTAAQRLVPGGTRREDHQTVRCGKPAAPTVTCFDRATARHTGHATVRCPVHHRTIRCGKPAAPTVTCSDRATARRTGQATVRCPVHHRTAQCATENSSFSPTALFVLGAINTPPTGHF